jgi:hypothetical protein
VKPRGGRGDAMRSVWGESEKGDVYRKWGQIRMVCINCGDVFDDLILFHRAFYNHRREGKEIRKKVSGYHGYRFLDGE